MLLENTSIKHLWIENAWQYQSEMHNKDIFFVEKVTSVG
jgi:hypothetical protein